MCSWIRRLDVVKIPIIYKIVSATPNRILTIFFYGKVTHWILKCIRKCKGPTIAKTNLIKNQILQCAFKTIIKLQWSRQGSIVIKQMARLMKHIKNPEEVLREIGR